MKKKEKIIALVMLVGLLMLSVPALALGVNNPTDLSAFGVQIEGALYDGSFVSYVPPGAQYDQKIRITVPVGTNISALETSFEADPTSQVWIYNLSWKRLSSGDIVDFSNGAVLQVVSQDLHWKDYVVQVVEQGFVYKADLLTCINHAQWIHDSKAEGNQTGQVKPGSRAVLQAAIDAAKLVNDDPAASQVNVDGAAVTLLAALDAFWSEEVPPETAAIDAAIALAQSRLAGAIRGTDPGEYPGDAIDWLAAELAWAESVKAFGFGQEVLDGAAEDLLAEIAIFDAARVPFDLAALNAAIASAQAKLNSAVEGAKAGNYTVGSKAALQAAVDAALFVKNNAEASQVELDAAAQSLNTAIAFFDAAIVVVTKTALNEAISAAQAKLEGAAEGTSPGNYAVGSKDALLAAVDSALEVKNNSEVTQAEVNAAVQTLNNAVAAFEAGKVPPAAPETPDAPAQGPSYPGKLIMSGSKGDSVRLVQERLNVLGYSPGPIDGIFGPKTRSALVAFQTDNGLAADGIIGPLTWGKLWGSGTQPTTVSTYPGLIKFGMQGSNVKAVQTKLNSLGYNSGPVDGIFGSQTLKAVKSFQAGKGLSVDGLVGPKTWSALFN